jgi:hypothetical protein
MVSILLIGIKMSKILSLFIWLKSRLSEPSTMASIAAVSALAGVQVDSGLVKDILNVGTVGFGVLGFFFKEAKPETVVN